MSLQKIIIITAPSGAGKTTIVKKIISGNAAAGIFCLRQHP